MFKTKHLLVIAHVIGYALATTGAFAAEKESRRDYGLYVGTGIGFINTNAEDAFEQDVSFKVGEAFAGVYWRWIGLETRTGLSLEDEIIDIGEDPDTGEFITAKTQLTDFNTHFLRLQLQNEVARIYALIGHSTVSTTSTFSTGEVTQVTDSGSAYGVGLGMYVNERLFFNIEYKSLFESETLSLPMVGATVDFRIF